MNPAVRPVADLPGRGAALLAARPIKPGELLLSDSPLLLYPNLSPSSSSPSSSSCSNCFRTLTVTSPTVSCPACPAAFCSDSCRSAALVSSHSPWACQSLSRLRLEQPDGGDDDDVATQAAFLIAAYNLAALDPAAFLRLLSLHGGPADHPSPALPARLHSIILSLSPPPGPVGLSPELTAALLAKDRMNSFGLMEPAVGGARRVRAYGVYAAAALFNHDCLPNVARFDYVDRDGPGNVDLEVRAVHEIEAGRELCLSYFPVNWSFRDRQQRLSEDYGFVCDCDRCRVESHWKQDEHEHEHEHEDEDEDENEDEDKDEEEQAMEDDEEGDDEGDFPHSYFFVRFMCQKEDCGGTLAPLPPSAEGQVSRIAECNACGDFVKVDCDDDDDDDEVMG